jgi:hypothetical protein
MFSVESNYSLKTKIISLPFCIDQFPDQMAMRSKAWQTKHGEDQCRQQFYFLSE